MAHHFGVVCRLKGCICNANAANVRKRREGGMVIYISVGVVMGQSYAYSHNMNETNKT